MPGRAAASCAAALALLALASSWPVQAHPESSAPTLRPDVLRAWHEPFDLAAHEQWHGFLQFAPGSNVTAAAYQVCQVGKTCFAPPAPAEDLGNGTFGFDTQDYTVNGQPVDYEPGWRLGVKWFLTESPGNRTVEFPRGPDLSSPECAGDGALDCSEQHYLTFDLPAAPKGAPLGPLAILALMMALAAMAGRRPLG